MTDPQTHEKTDRPGDFPPAPWQMHGSLWLSVFRLGRDAGDRHPAGVYGAAFVSYREPSPLTYGELLVARTTKTPSGGKAVTITDIWVDSPASLAGGRTLWAIPKDLCDFDLESTFRGPLTSTAWRATVERRPVAEASFTDVSRAAPRAPFRGLVDQPPIPEHPGRGRAGMSGSAKALPCRGRWSFDADGPLAFLREARQLGSFRMADFRLRFE